MRGIILTTFLFTGLVACSDKGADSGDTGHGDHTDGGTTDGGTDGGTTDGGTTDGGTTDGGTTDGGTTDGGTTDGGTTDGGTTDGGTTEMSWSDMDRTERLTYMSTVVVPEMQALWDKAGVKDTVTCVTCHGSDYVEVDYAMPNSVPPLPYDGFPYSESDDPYIAAVGAFMEDMVHPRMGELLGYDLYDYDTNPGGFSCYGCHLYPE